MTGYARIKKDGITEDDLVVKSADIWFARQFGASGYNEGAVDLALAIRAVDFTFSKPAGAYELHAAAAGIADPHEDANVALLSDPRIRAILEGHGFDGFVGHDVLGNEEYPCEVAWRPGTIAVQPVHEEGLGTAMVVDGPALSLWLTTAGRDRLFDLVYGRFEQAGDVVGRLFSEVTAVNGRFQAESSDGDDVVIVDMHGGLRFELKDVDPVALASEGSLVCRDLADSPGVPGP